MVLKNQVIKQSFFAYIFIFFSVVFGYAIKSFYAKNLSVVEFGLFYSCIGFLGILSMFVSFGFFQSLMFYGRKLLDQKQFGKFKYLFIFSVCGQIVLALFFAGILWVCSDYLVENYFKSDLLISSFKWFILYFFLFSIIKPFYSFFNLIFKYIYFNLYAFLFAFLNFVFSVILFVFEVFSFDKLIMIWCLSLVILFIFYIILFLFNFKNIAKYKMERDNRLIKKFYMYGFGVVFGFIGSIIIGRMDVQMITYFVGLGEVAVYEVALSLAKFMSFLVSPLSLILAPIIPKLVSRGEKSMLSKIISIVYMGLVVIFCPVFLFVMKFSRQIVGLLFDFDFFFSTELVLVLFLAIFMSLFQIINFQFLNSLGMIKITNKILFFGASLNFLGNFLGLYLFGIVGIAYFSLVAFFFMAVWSFVEMRREKVTLKFREWFLLKLVLVNVFLFYFIDLLVLVEFQNIYYKYFFILVSVGLVYLFCLIYFRIFNFYYVLDELKIEIPKRLRFLKVF